MKELSVFVFDGQAEGDFYQALYLVLAPDDSIFEERWNGKDKEDAAPAGRKQVLRMSEAWELLEDAQAHIKERLSQIRESLPHMSSDRVRQKWEQPQADLEAALEICAQMAERFEAKRSFP